MTTVGNGYTPVEYTTKGNQPMFSAEGFYDSTRTPTLVFTIEAIKRVERNKYISYMVINDAGWGEIDDFAKGIRWMFALGRGDGKLYYNVHGKGCETTLDYKSWDLYELEYDTLNKFPTSGKMIFGSNGYEYYGYYYTRRINDARYNKDVLLSMAKYIPQFDLDKLMGDLEIKE
jgi:hypothetical protein